MAMRRWSSAVLQARTQLLHQQQTGHASSTAAAPAWFARHYAILKEGGAASQSSSEAGTTATPLTSASWIGGKKPVIQDPSQTAHTTDAHLSQQLNASSDASEALPTESVFFDGFFSRPHKRLKYVSLGQAFIATASAPLMMMQADDGSMAASAAVAGSMVMALGWATTCAFHWFTSPYVHKLEYEPSSQMVQAYTLSIFGKEQVHCFSLAGVEYADTWKPLSTFKAHGRVFYIERERFPHKGLLQALSPPNPMAEALQQAAKLQQEQEQQ